MTVRKLVGKLHLWLGLSSGLVVFIVSITGCIYVFQPELFELTHHSLVRVAVPAQARPLPLTVVWQRAQQALGADKPLLSGTAYHAPDRAWQFMAYQGNAGQPYFGGMITYHRTVFIDPYTGNATGILDNKYEFFQLVKWLHWGLFLGTAGEYVVGISTLIFVVMLVSGLVLWWPKNRAARKQRFAVKWDASGKRLNYDLHNVLGFYLALVGLVIALSGLVWAFEWVDKSVSYLATGRTEAAKPAPEPLLPTTAPAASPLDAAFADAWQRVPLARSISVGTGKPDQPLRLRVGMGEQLYRTNSLSYHPVSGQFLGAEDYRTKPAGEQLVAMNYDIHVGALLGWPTKILAFGASLLMATLPITGFYIWWGRLKKNKKKHLLPQLAAK